MIERYRSYFYENRKIRLSEKVLLRNAVMLHVIASCDLIDELSYYQNSDKISYENLFDCVLKNDIKVSITLGNVYFNLIKDIIIWRDETDNLPIFSLSSLKSLSNEEALKNLKKEFVNKIYELSSLQNIDLLIEKLLGIKYDENLLMIDDNLGSHLLLKDIGNKFQFYSNSIEDDYGNKLLALEDIIFEMRYKYLNKKHVYDYGYLNIFNTEDAESNVSTRNFWKNVYDKFQIISKKLILICPSGLLTMNDFDGYKGTLISHYIEGVIKLPPFKFSSCMNLVILNKNKESDSIKFLDATEMAVSNRLNTKLNVEKIYESYFYPLSSEMIKEVPIDELMEHQIIDLNVDKWKYYGNFNLDNTIELSELANDIFRGAELRKTQLDSLKPTEGEKVCKMVTVKDLDGTKVNKDNLEKIKFDEKLLGRYLLKNNDILISAKFSQLKISLIEIDDTETLIANESLIVVRLDENKMIAKVLYLYLNSEEGLQLLDSITTKRIINSIPIADLRKLPIKQIDVENQVILASRIAEIENEIDYHNQKIEELNMKYKSLL